MENEMVMAPEEISEAPVCSDLIEEEPVCTEDEFAPEEEQAPSETIKDKVRSKYGKVKSYVRGKRERVKTTLQECTCNPYIKQTHTYKIEIYRDRTQQELIDSREIVDEKAFSLSSLLLAGTVAAALVCTAGVIVKNLFD